MKPMRCSSLLRHFLCPGSLVAEAYTLVPRESAEDEAEKSGAVAGTALHAQMAEVLRHRPLPDTELPREIAWCLDCIEWPEADAYQPYVEQPLAWDFLEGHPDFYFLADNAISLYDWKMGWGAEHDPADLNLQEMGYAVLASKVHDVCNVTVALCCPNHPEPESRLTRAYFDTAALETAQATLGSIWERALKPDAMRKPSPKACRYCKAKGTANCPESTASLQIFAKQEVDVPAIPNEKLLELMKAASLAKALADAILAEGKHRLKEGSLETEDWMLTKGRTKRTFGETFPIWNILKDQLSEDKKERAQAFLSCCSISWTKLLKAYKTATGLKGPAAEEKLIDDLGEFLSVTEGSPTLRAR